MTLLLVGGVVLFANELFAAAKKTNSNSSVIQKRIADHKKDIADMEAQWGIIRSANRYEKEEKYEEAITLYLKALTMGNQNVPRLSLLEIYEKTEQYEKALDQVEWFLRGNQNEQGRAETLATKQRLLRKIEEQKSWEAKQDPIVPKFKKAFDGADRVQQQQFLEGLGGEGVWDVFKNAMTAEHGGDFSRAREIYESLLPRKEEIDAQMGPGGWAMLYPAIQRTSEFMGDTPREKEALVWIQANLLDPRGEHHASLAKLQPQVVAHLRKRIEVYRL
jgi:tetratricopeptide (TPR) repeat protein